MALRTETFYNVLTGEDEEYVYDDGSGSDDDGSTDVNAGASGGTDTDFPGDDDTTGIDAGDVIPGVFNWGSAPGENSGAVDSTTGNITYRYDDGSSLTVDRNGNVVSNTESPDARGNSVAVNRALAWTNRTFGSTAAKVFANVMKNPGASVLTALAAAKAFSGSDKQGGYNKPVPQMDVVREQIDYNDPNRRPGSGGRQYITDTRYVKEGDAESLAAARGASEAQKQGILAAYKPAAKEVNPYAGKMKTKWNTAAATDATTKPAGGIADVYLDPVKNNIIGAAPSGPIGEPGSITPGGGTTTDRPVVNRDKDSSSAHVITPPPGSYSGERTGSGIPAGIANQDKYYKPAYDGSDMEPRITIPVGPPPGEKVAARDVGNMMDQQRAKYADINSVAYANGGIAMLAKGGEPRYLQGQTDGMADEIPSNIDGKQEAALSHGEFVIPADVVSHLGNGNSDAGAKKLYQMMDRIREARTGTKEQGKEINPDSFMPGGLAKAYAYGGAVQRFNAGGGATSSGGVPLDVSRTSTLSPWAGDYVTNMLGQADALSKTPTAVYKGPLTAGASDLQQQGFAGISDIASAGFDPTKFATGTFDTGAASKYMNPYLSAVLNPQMEELRRQNAITNMGANAKLTQAGAYGGGRQAIVNAENDRNLMQELNKTVGTGYANAFDKAMAQFNTEQGRQFDVDKASEASRQFSADYGLKTAKDLLDAGAVQRGITGEGIAADKRQFEEQQADPYNRLEFKRKMLEGLPIGASTTAVDQDAISKIQSDISGLASLYKTLEKLGIKP